MAVESRRRTTLSFLFTIIVLTWIKLSIMQTTLTDKYEDMSVVTEEHIKTGEENTGDIFTDSANPNIYFNTTPPSPGVILFTKGGIGNQLFEFACSYALARDLNRTLYNFVTPSSLSHDRKYSANQRHFALDKFQIPLDNFIDKSTIINASQVTYVDDEQLLFQRNYSANTFLQLTPTGYCQSEEYWFKYRQELKEMFTPRDVEVNSPKIASIAEEIESSESVAVHVRRGDFLVAKGFYVPISYQRIAMHKMSKLLKERGASASPTFFVFSDDTAYVREQFERLAETYNFKFVFVSEANNTSIQDFYLMTKCKHFVIPNSTFAWWAAYLGQSRDKIVIASVFNPKFWDMWKGSKSQRDFYLMLHGRKYHRKEWIVMNPFVGEY